MLAQIVKRVVKRGGSIVISSFAIGGQDVHVLLRQLEDQQRIPACRFMSTADGAGRDGICT